MHCSMLCILLMFIAALIPACRSNPTGFMSKTLHGSTKHLCQQEDKLYVGTASQLVVLDRELNMVTNVSTCPPKSKCHLTNKFVLCGGKGFVLLCGATNKTGVCETRDSKTLHRTYQVSRRNLFGSAFQLSSPIIAVANEKQLFLAIGTNALQTSSHGAHYAVTRQSVDNFLTTGHLTYRTPTMDSVEYVHAYQDDSSIYFVVNVNNRARLVRICTADPDFSSYIELNLQCSPTGYERAVAATLVKKTRGPGINQLSHGLSLPSLVVLTDFNGTSPTSLCFYSFARIMDALRESVSACNKRLGGPVEYLAGDDSLCASAGGMRRQAQCPTSNLRPGRFQKALLLGNKAVEAVRFKVTPSSVTGTPSSISVVSHYGLFVILIGGSAGYIDKFYYDVDAGDFHLIKYGNSFFVEKSSNILSPSVYSRNGHHVFALSTTKIIRLDLITCQRYSTCQKCLQAADPLCGWCTFQGACVSKHSCREWRKENRYLTSKKECPRFRNFIPPSLHVSETREITVFVAALPSLSEGDGYYCKFGQSKLAEARIEADGALHCLPPFNANLRSFATTHDAVIKVPLSIVYRGKYSDPGVEVIKEFYPYYSCHQISTCSACVKEGRSCKWCTYDNKCAYIHDEAACSTKNPNSIVFKAQRCPHIKMLHKPIAVSSGQLQNITFPAANLPAVDSEVNGYVCRVRLGQQISTLPAYRANNSMLTCISRKNTFSFPENIGEKTAHIELKWNDNFPLDTKSPATVKVYKCLYLGRSCTRCLGLKHMPAAYQCDWCHGHCSSTCHIPSAGSCGKPTVSQVYPLRAPIDGGIVVNFIGKNLGVHHSDIQSVTVAGTPCIVIPDLYVAATRIACRVASSMSPKKGPAIVHVSQGVVVSKYTFAIWDAEVYGILPSFGPLSGGTRVQVTGKGFSQHDNIRVLMGKSECVTNGFQKSDSSLFCLTSGSSNVSHVTVSVSFGSHAARSLIHGYKYVSDPIISSIRPRSSFISAGRIVTVLGENFHVIQEPLMFVTFREIESNRTNCKKFSATELHCPSPPPPQQLVAAVNRSRTVRSAATNPGYNTVLPTLQTDYLAQFGFVMDGVKSVQDLKGSFPSVNSVATYYPDPIYEGFPTDVRVYKGDALILVGKGLNAACRRDEVTVTIGEEICDVITLEDQQLVCAPPEAQPAVYGSDGSTLMGEYPVVTVRIGNFHKVLGKLKYNITKSSFVPAFVIPAVIALSTTLVLSICFVILWHKWKARRARREYKKVQYRLDALESNVRNECKKAFAELQTDISDLATTIPCNGIPYWEYPVYASKILYPNQNNYSLLSSPGFSLANLPMSSKDSLSLFESFLSEKQFVVLFVRSLEEQRSFSVRDKVNVAALLTIVLHDRMDYATDIMKVLLAELIEKVISKKHPKLMLRRTESIVEKFLTNWLSLCLYDYLKQFVGGSLFTLVTAIQHQLLKGPIDAITYDAKYSLSEDRLLKEKVSYEQITLQVRLEAGEFVPVNVLDCDTVTQVKEKILSQLYKNQPASMCPRPCDVILHWHTDAHSLILEDDDLSTQSVGEYRRINTMAHYQVQNDAVVTLSCLQRQFGSLLNNSYSSYTADTNGRLTLNGLQNNSFKSSSVRLSQPHLDNSLRSLLPSASSRPVVTTQIQKRCHLVTVLDELNTGSPCSILPGPEIYLTRLLYTKAILQKFIDDLMDSILQAQDTVPVVVKFLFDFLDDQARKHGITDPDVVFTWKSNSLPLRFWVNLIKNPDFIFDINKSHVMDSCLSVIGQTLMDSCSRSEHQLGSDSPSNKLLFARDIPRYHQLVQRFYSDIERMPHVSDERLVQTMKAMSSTHVCELDRERALTELYAYAVKYQHQILECLSEFNFPKHYLFASHLQAISLLINSTNTSVAM